MKIVAASSHLLNEFARQTRADPDFAARNGLSLVHQQHLNHSCALNDPANFPGAHGEWAGTRWWWYHCGDGNHFGMIYKPNDLDRCYHDPAWCAMCTRQILSYPARGYRPGTIREFVDALDYSAAVELPPLLDGCWNPRGSEGLLCWMGKNGTIWENDAAVLAAVARARSRLVAADSAIRRLGLPPEASKLDAGQPRGSAVRG